MNNSYAENVAMSRASLHQPAKGCLDICSVLKESVSQSGMRQETFFLRHPRMKILQTIKDGKRSGG